MSQQIMDSESEANSKEPFETWKVIEKLTHEFGLSPHQVGSVNHFIQHIHHYIPLPLEIKCPKPKVGGDCREILHRFVFSNPVFYVPKISENDNSYFLTKKSGYEKGDEMRIIYPSEARDRSLYYSAPFHMDFLHEVILKDFSGNVISKTFELFEKVYIGEFKVMKNSILCTLNSIPSPVHGEEHLMLHKECKYNTGGDVIIEGEEKIFISQERMCSNVVLVSSTDEGMIAEIRSHNESTNLQTSQFLVILSLSKTTGKWDIGCKLPYVIYYNLPLFVLLGCLGYNTREEQYECILGHIDDWKDKPCSEDQDEENIQSGNAPIQSIRDYYRLQSYLEPSMFEFQSAIDLKTPEGCLKMVKNIIPFPETMQDSILRFYKMSKNNLVLDPYSNLELQTFIEKIKNSPEFSNHYQILQNIANQKLSNHLDTNFDSKIEFINEDLVTISAEDAIEFCDMMINDFSDKVNQKNMDYLYGMLNKDLLPHLGNQRSDFNKKAKFLGYMVRTLLLRATKKLEFDNRDLLSNKRVDTPGQIIKNMFLEAMRNITKDLNSCAMQMDNGKTMSNLRTFIKKKGYFNDMKNTAKTGKWNTSELNPVPKSNITSPNLHLGFPAYVSLKNRFVTPLKKTGRFYGPRRLNGQHYGYLCKDGTPDNDGVGLTKDGAFSLQITKGFPSYTIFPHLVEFCNPLDKVSFRDIHRTWKVFVNGYWWGNVENPVLLLQDLRNKRRNLIIHYETGITALENEKIISIRTDQGRFLRPLYIVENGKLVWNGIWPKRSKHINAAWMLLQKWIEFIDVSESENCYIAFRPSDLNKEHTHCELHPSMMFGHIAGSIPFMNHKPTTRAMFACQMEKQTSSLSTLAFQYRNPSITKYLEYMQKPLITTPIANLSHFNELSRGQKLVLLIASYAKNQEDQLILMRNFQQYSGGSVIRSKTIKDEEMKTDNKHREYFGVLNSSITKNGQIMDFRDEKSIKNIDPEDGFPQPDDFIDFGQIAISKYSQTEVKAYDGNKSATSFKYRDLSKNNKTVNDGYVAQVMLTQNAIGTNSGKVKLLSQKKVVAGNKFTNSSQKGVVSHIFLSPKDAPFQKNTGLTPDAIINPCAFPSRSTLNYILEVMGCKVAATTGKQKVIPTFDTEDGMTTLEQFEKELKESGFDSSGVETFVDAITGEEFEAKMFVGLAYYYPLKHFAEDKMHARSTGPIQVMTRQPVEGRRKEGGSKLEEMGRDALLGHGAPRSIQERSFKRSDESRFYVCKTCGHFAYPLGKHTNHVKCNFCGTIDENIGLTAIPYAPKLLFDELTALGLYTKMGIEPINF